jgi:hypothetical protein
LHLVGSETETQNPTKKRKIQNQKKRFFLVWRAKLKHIRPYNLTPHLLSIRMSTLALHAMRSRLPTIDETEEIEELIDSPKSPEGTKFKLLLRRHPTLEKFMVICEREDGSANVDAWLSEERANDAISWWQTRIKEGGYILASLFQADD